MNRSKIFALDARDGRPPGGLDERGMGATERRFVAFNPRDIAQQCARRRACQQCGKQRIFPGAGSIDGIDSVIRHSHSLLRSGRSCLRDTPVAASTAIARRTGPLSQLETGGFAMPTLAGKLGYAGRCVDGTIKARITQVDLRYFRKVPRRLMFFY